MNYPLDLSFKIMAIARQLSVTDVGGSMMLYVKQKAFKFKEAVTVYADSEQTRPLYTINADRVIDFNAVYHVHDMNGKHIVDIQRHGMKSLWRTRYGLMGGAASGASITEMNPWAKVGDSFFGEIPILGMFSGYLFHPTYQVHRSDGTPVLEIEKKPAFFEGKFRVHQMTSFLNTEEEESMVLSLLMMVLLERSKG